MEEQPTYNVSYKNIKILNMKKTTRIIHIGLTEKEEKIVEKIEAESYLGEIIRSLIREYGYKNYKEEKGYSEAARLRAKLALEKHHTKKEIDGMTNEEYAEQVLKAVVKGPYAWIATLGGNPFPLVLSQIKDVTQEDSGIIKHLAIVNNTPIADSFGVEISEDQKREARENLEKKKMEDSV